LSPCSEAGCFEKAKKYEKETTPTGGCFTWPQCESLNELEARALQIKAEYKNTLDKESKARKNVPLMQLFDTTHVYLDYEEENAGFMCDL
jgi:hypothetical protein